VASPFILDPSPKPSPEGRGKFSFLRQSLKQGLLEFFPPPTPLLPAKGCKNRLPGPSHKGLFPFYFSEKKENESTDRASAEVVLGYLIEITKD